MRGKYASLEDWAASKPSISEVEEVAACLVKKYVEGEGLDLHRMASQSADSHDPVREDTMCTHHLLLLYEELSYTLNAGDIGRVEDLFVPWVLLFRATGNLQTQVWYTDTPLHACIILHVPRGFAVSRGSYFSNI